MAKAVSAFDIAQSRGVNLNPWNDLMFKNMLVQNQQYTPEEANKTFDIVRGLPEYQAQQAGVTELEGELNRLKRLPQVSGDTWLKPLLALTDSETGSNLSSGYQDNDVSQKRNEMILKYQDALANRQKQSAETLMSGLGKFKSGTKTEVDSTDTTGAKIGADLSKTDAGNQTRLDTAVISAAKKGSGQKKNIYEESFARKGAEDATKFLSAGGASKFNSMAGEIEGIASTLEAKKGNLISPTGRGGAVQSFFSGLADEDVAQAMDKADALAVELSSDSFKGSTSDRDAKIMAGGLVSKRGKEENIAEGLRKKAATIRHIGEKQELKFRIQSQGGTSAQVEAALKAADDAFYGPTGAGSTTKAPTGAAPKAAATTGPKEGDTTILKSGKKATFKGGKWQL